MRVRLVRGAAHHRSLLRQMASKEMVNSIDVHGALDRAVEARWTPVLGESDDPAEEITAFVEKRKPRFSWASDGSLRNG